MTLEGTSLAICIFFWPFFNFFRDLLFCKLLDYSELVHCQNETSVEYILKDINALRVFKVNNKNIVSTVALSIDFHAVQLRVLFGILSVF